MITANDIAEKAITGDRLVFSFRVHHLARQLMENVNNSDIQGLSSEEMDRLIIQMLSDRLTLNS